jgi:hypothetical protein
LFLNSIGCSHSASITFFTDSITNKNCNYYGYPCDSQSNFDSGNCFKCSAAGCNRMGYWASPNKDTGKLFLQTQTPTGSTFCMYHYFVTLSMGRVQNQNKAKGKFSIQMGNSANYLIDNEATEFYRNSKQYRLISQTSPLVSSFNNIYVSYARTSNFFIAWWYDNQWNFEWVEVLNGNTQEKTGWKQTSTWIVSGRTMQFNRAW